METENKVGLVLWIIQERTAGQTGRRGLFTGGSSHRGDPAGGSGSAPALPALPQLHHTLSTTNIKIWGYQ